MYFTCIGIYLLVFIFLVLFAVFSQYPIKMMMVVVVVVEVGVVVVVVVVMY